MEFLGGVAFGGGVVLTEEGCHCGVGLEVFYAPAMPRSHFFPWPMDQDVELSAPSPAHVCLHTTMSHHDDNALNL